MASISILPYEVVSRKRPSRAKVSLTYIDVSEQDTETKKSLIQYSTQIRFKYEDKEIIGPTSSYFVLYPQDETFENVLYVGIDTSMKIAEISNSNSTTNTVKDVIAPEALEKTPKLSEKEFYAVEDTEVWLWDNGDPILWDDNTKIKL